MAALAIAGLTETHRTEDERHDSLSLFTLALSPYSSTLAENKGEIIAPKGVFADFRGLNRLAEYHPSSP